MQNKQNEQRMHAAPTVMSRPAFLLAKKVIPNFSEVNSLVVVGVLLSIGMPEHASILMDPTKRSQFL
jgi:hypothetical protein